VIKCPDYAEFCGISAGFRLNPGPLSENWTIVLGGGSVPERGSVGSRHALSHSGGLTRDATRRYRVTVLTRPATLVQWLHVTIALAGRFSFSILLAQNGFTRKLYLVAFAPNTLHENLLSFLQFIANIFHATIGDL
jgi:hypothetical protein